MRLPTRRTLWTSALLLCALVGVGFIAVSIAMLAPLNLVSHGKFDLINDRMTHADVLKILGTPTSDISNSDHVIVGHWWRDGPSWIELRFSGGNVYYKRISDKMGATSIRTPPSTHY